MIVSDILGRVRPLLNDTDASGYRWSNADLITYINDACRLVLIKRPDSNTSLTGLTLVDGAIQTLPSTAYKLIDVICNLGANDAQGRRVTIVEGEVLDQFSPSWRSGTRLGSVKHYLFDPRTPRRYEVYPPVLNGTKIQAKVALYTGTATDPANDIGLSDEYMEHLVIFTLYKAYARDMEFAGNAELAASYLALFNGMLADKVTADNAFAPAMNRKGDQPRIPAQQIGGV
jgi:hypothetical protein